MADQRIPELFQHIRSAQVLVPCTDLAASLAFFTEKLGFRVEVIAPADAPTTAVLSGYGLCLRLESNPRNAVKPSAPTLRLACNSELLPLANRTLLGPDGIRIELVDAATAIDVPEGTQEFVLCRFGDEQSWGVGRAGMQYRDLIPNRLGGRFVASHIRIPEGGEVPDYVHYHKVRFQMIYCKAGWVRVVYEDQGAPFLLHAGDCVLQPPEIRHRVLEASAGLEVIEIGCPAIHDTCADHALQLPTPQVLPERVFGTQRFVRHVASDAQWRPSRMPGFEVRESGIAAATSGLACVRVIRNFMALPFVAADPDLASATEEVHDGEFLFLFVLGGQLGLASAHFGSHLLEAGDSCVIPSGADYTLRASGAFEALEVRLPA